MSAAPAEEAPAKGGSKKLIIILAAALVIVLVGAGLFIKSMSGSAQAAEPVEDPKTTFGAVVALEDEMTLNLADGRFLKTQLSLQLSEAKTLELGEKAVAKFDGSMARDAAISILSKYTYSELLKAEVREKAQEKLSEEAKERYEGDVLKVYFTQFVMQ